MALQQYDSAWLEFLIESNAIEEITNVDYSLDELRAEGRGHYGALASAYAMGLAGRPLTEAEVVEWQRCLVEEQRAFGHSVPAEFAGRLRGMDLPISVRVGAHIAPPFDAVGGLFAAWLAELNVATASWRPYSVDDTDLARVLGAFFQRFEALHPFGDGNGRTGRLVLAYLCVRAGVPLVVVRRTDRPAFYRAHRSKVAMQAFMAEKIRERVRWLDGQILSRTETFELADSYARPDGQPGLLVERHQLIAAAGEWAAKAAAKDRT